MDAWSTDALPTHPLVADLVLVYARDSEHGMTHLKSERDTDVAEAASDDAERAIDNLCDIVDQIDPFFLAEIARATCDGNYDTSLILMPDLWEQLEDRFGPSRASGVSTRDVLLIADARNARHASLLERLTTYCCDAFTQRVSPRLYAYRAGQIAALPN